MTHNGWTNYATWRVNLEFFDGLNFLPVDEHPVLNAEVCKEYVEEYLEMNAEGLALDYAMAFIADVNWHEIASHINGNNEE
jgi:hypothetical protein